MRLASSGGRIPGQTGMNETVILRRIIVYLERNCHTVASIDALAAEFGIKRRGLYDFIAICSTFGICQRRLNNSVEWLGIDQSASALQALREQVRHEASDRELRDIFNYSVDPSLQRLGVAVVKLFLFLRVKFLDLRKVGRIFAQGKAKYKTMLRKLYTVSAGLELAGIVRKTTLVSEIQLRAPLDAESDGTPMGLNAILNTSDEIERERMCEKRRKEFEALYRQLVQPASRPADQSRIPLPPLRPGLASWN